MQTLFKSIENFMSMIDLYGGSISFRIQGQKKFSSIIGKLCTFFLILPIFILIIMKLVESYQQQKPNVYQVQKKDPNPERQYLGTNNFTFAITLVDHAFPFLPKQKNLYQFNLQQCTKKRASNYTPECIRINLTQCDREKHFKTPQQQEFFKNFNLSPMSCIKFDEIPVQIKMNNMLKYIQGVQTSDEFTFLNLYVSACVNSSDCAAPELIEQQLDNGIFQMYISSNLVDDTQAINHYIQTTVSQAHIFQRKKMKGVINNFVKDTTYTDNGMILEQINIDNTLILQSTFSENIDKIDQSIFFRLGLALQENTNIRYRNYDKLFDIVGKSGGVLSFVRFIFSLFILPLINSIMETKIAIQISDYSKPLLKQQTLKNELPKKDKTYQNKYSRVLQFLQGKNWKEQMSFYEIVKLSIKKLLNLENLINIQNNIIEDNLDIVTIIKKLQEIDKLKQILLSKDQQNLFSLMTLKNINPQEINLIQNIIDQTGQPEKECVAINETLKNFGSYKKILYNPQKTQSDIKLLLYMNMDHQQIFDILDSEYKENLREKESINSVDEDMSIIQSVRNSPKTKSKIINLVFIE